MQMTKEHAFISAEVQELRRILERIPHKKVITRRSYERRLQRAEEMLTHFGNEDTPQSMTITFKGKPVRGTEGIYADFAGEATSALSDLYATLVANLKGLMAATTGPVPEGDKHQLVITGVAKGSFGFTLELPREIASQQLSLFGETPSATTQAHALLENVLFQAIQGDDENLSESLIGLETRTIKKIYDFFDIMQKNDALFSFKSRHREICASSTNDIKRARQRLDIQNVTDREESYVGRLTGLLPHYYEFEFTKNDTAVIRGKLPANFQDIASLNAFLNQDSKIVLHVRSIGQGKPRYILHRIADITLY